jgi:hypothetical protein
MQFHNSNPLSWTTLWALAGLLLLLSSQPSFAQGCVAARGAGMTDAHNQFSAEDDDDFASRFQTSFGYRWFRSGRHFVGDVEQTIREAQQTAVKNNSSFFDIGISYAITHRVSATLTVPFAVNSRSQVVRDSAGNNLDRFATESAGLGDMRMTADFWLFEPDPQRSWNLLLGLGFSAPTGNKGVQDIFEVYDKATKRIYALHQPVDESIQLGIGGWGIPFEFYGFANLTSNLQAYAEGFYSVTPQGTNGIPTNRSNPYEAVISVADSYMSRVGASYTVLPQQHMSVSLGARIEGVPVRDLVGSSNGFRRPGYAVSIEPGVSCQLGSWALSLYTPVAVYRNRLQSVADQQLTAATGVYQHGDAAFADFSIITSVAKRW